MKDSLFILGKVKGFSIVESITALVIILISFGIGMSIYLNVISSERIIAGSTAHLQLANMMEEIKKNKSYSNETLELENMIIEKKIHPYPKGQSNYRVHLSAFDYQKKLLAEINEIVYLPISQD